MCKDFGQNCPKSLHLPPERLSVPAEKRIVTMSKFRKNSSFWLFLRNCAALAAQINRFAFYSADIIIRPAWDEINQRSVEFLFFWKKLLPFPILIEYAFSSVDATSLFFHIAVLLKHCLFPTFFGKYPPPGLAGSVFRQ